MCLGWVSIGRRGGGVIEVGGRSEIRTSICETAEFIYWGFGVGHCGRDGTKGY